MPRLYAYGSTSLAALEDTLAEHDDLRDNTTLTLVDSDCELVAASWTQLITRAGPSALTFSAESDSTTHYLGHDSFEHWLDTNTGLVISRDSRQSRDHFSLIATNARGEFLGVLADDFAGLKLYPTASSLLEHDPPPSTLAVPFAINDYVVSITAGASHFVLLTSTGAVYTLGDNRFSQLGIPAHTNVDPRTLVRVEIFDGLPSPVTSIASGDFHNVVLTKDGDAYAFGSDKFGQCGGFADSDGLPQLLELGRDVDDEPVVTKIACGPRHTIILTDMGIYVSGSNEHGQLGRSVSSKVVREFARSESLSREGNVTNVLCTRNRTFVEVDHDQE
ncbi:hypothetical protein OIV83_001233 [Microbotryomycetes sp. JL201]|nr:hypothetical protein OIV83_001233 [Microbotryomycetes sp. JL201]